MSDAGGSARSREAYARRVTAYRIASRAYFHLPIIVVFLVHQGFGALWIAAQLALYVLVAALGDQFLVPLKARLSLAGCLVVGEGIKTVGLLVLMAPVTHWSVALSQLLSGLGFCLTAGTDAALASTLRSGERYRSQESAAQVGMFLISFLAGLAGAAGYAYLDRLPFLLSALACLLAGALVAWPGGRPLVRGDQVPPTAAVAGGGGGALAYSTRFWASYYSVNRAILLASYTFLLPLLLFFQARLTVAMFGAVLGLYTLLGLVSVRLSAWMGRRWPGTAVFWFTGGSMVLGLVLLAPGRLWTTGCGIALLGLAGGAVRPTTMTFLGPAMAGLPDGERQRITRGLERRQGIIQAVLLMAAGGWLATGAGPTGAVLGYTVIAVAFQLSAWGAGAATYGPRRGIDFLTALRPGQRSNKQRDTSIY